MIRHDHEVGSAYLIPMLSGHVMQTRLLTRVSRDGFLHAYKTLASCLLKEYRPSLSCHHRRILDEVVTNQITHLSGFFLQEMARTKQTARKTTGGKAPRKQVCCARRRLLVRALTIECPARNKGHPQNYDGSFS